MKFVLAVFLSLILGCLDAQAWLGPSAKAAAMVIKPLIKHPQSLPENEIVRFAQLGRQTGGTKLIGQELSTLRLPSAVLEDTYMRIAIQQSKIQRAEAEGMIGRLNGVPGFQSTLSKIVGNSDIKTSGHLNELRIADHAAQRGYEVRGIGMPFIDANKGAPTDIDVLLQRRGKVIAIEAKDYLPTTSIPLDKFRADMVTLKEYAKHHGTERVVKVFSMTHQPNDELSKRLLDKEAFRHGVELIYGAPEEQVIQIIQLEKLL